jgi:Type II secretion system (T2SS), protein G
MTSKEAQCKSGRHLYSRGWFGLIPLVGGFVGIGLILLGVFKYKDKKLSLIGFAALLFTITIYSSIYIYFTYSKNGLNQWAEASKMQLNSLVKDIEFYKLQHGSYPDSLQQLVSKDKIVFIYDPLLEVGQNTHDTKFNYLKIGDKYTVFSSGIDKIPNTSDDIYPEVVISDSSKIGLIRKR